ncbi:MAG: LysM peptidoglycan-binding domain-containing protein [Bdellovibrionales bacterium]
MSILLFHCDEVGNLGCGDGAPSLQLEDMVQKSQIQRSALAVSLALLISGCASLRGKSSSTGEPLGVQISGAEQASNQVMANIAKPYVSPLGEIALDETPLTQQWIKYFQGRGRRYMEVYLQRSSRYLPMMKNTLRENGLPEDLVYIALIESGFSPLAHSHANAVGYWQFIRATGKRYGLMVDPFIDERRDPVLSTRAAAEYFKTLYGMLNSWHLSMAAYNVGENRVYRVVNKYRSRDFWALIKNRRAFPKETKHYVPKFIAATLIAKDPAKYGFTNIPYEAPLSFDTVQLVNPVSMSKLAQSANIDVETLKLLNPKFRGDYVPQYRGADTMIRVPVGQSKVVAQAIPQSFSAAPKVIAAEHYFYRIRRGDSLSTIARKHRTSIANLKRLNGLGNRTLLRVGQKLKVPDRGGSFVTYEMPAYEDLASNNEGPDGPDDAADTPEIPKTVASNPKLLAATESQRQGAAAAAVVSEAREPDQADVEPPQKHVVRRGENLTIIARKYGLSVGRLRRLNRLNSRAVLRAGQTLRLKDEGEIEASKSNSAQDSRRTLAVVPSKIAKSEKAKEGPAGKSKKVAANKAKAVKVAKKIAPKVAGGSKIAKVSQDANLTTKKNKKSVAKNRVQKHTVAKGETLAAIAGRYRVSVGAIAKQNQIKNKSRLLAGSELVIPR